MGILRGIGKAVKPLVNFPRWMGLSNISATAKNITQTAKRMFVPQQATRQETFEEAVKRLRLTEKDIQTRMKSLFRMAIFYSLIAIGMLIYSGYLLIKVSFFAALLSFAITALVIALAFREHFWYFQMKQRRLGCTVKQWFNATFWGMGK